MAEFVCRVADANGRVFSQVEAAGTVDEARQKMTARGLYVYSVEARNSLVSGFTNRSRARQVSGRPSRMARLSRLRKGSCDAG